MTKKRVTKSTISKAAKPVTKASSTLKSLRKKLEILPRLANAKNKGGGLLTIQEIVGKMMMSLNEAEKNILRKRYGMPVA